MNPHRFTIPFLQERLSAASNAAIFNAADDREMSMLASELTFEQDDAEIYAALHSRGQNVTPRIEKGAFDRALIFLGKHGEFNKAMIARAWAMVKEGGDILVEGNKTDGIDSLIRGLKALGLTPEVEPKFHGKIAWFPREANRIGAINAWAKKDIAAKNQDGYITRAGIFSPTQIDKGTAFLLANLTIPLKGVVADFGGGYGAIAHPILERNPEIESLDFYEISHLACECAKANLQDPRAHIHWLSVSKAAREYYNTIITNPPFHKTREGDPSIGLGFIDAAARSLRAKGTAYLVANRHLPYETRLRARFGHVEIFAENNAYKIFKATRPQGKNI